MTVPVTFKPPVVCRALSISQATLNRWFGDGFLDCLDVARTKVGVARRFTFEDACTVAVMAQLCDLGMSPAAASDAADAAVRAADQYGPAVSELIYRRYPEEGKGHIGINGQPFRPGALLTLSLDLHVLFRDTASRLRAAEAALQPPVAAGASCDP